jgi:tellurite resistance protein TerC
MFGTVPLWAWAALLAFIFVVVIVDVMVFGRRPHEITFRAAVVWSLVWLALGIGFTGVMWAWQGSGAATEYFTGYLLERALSVDNIFVFALIFSYFNVPTELRHRALLWGILGALVLRFAFILAGVALIERFSWMLYIFGAFLVYTAWKMAMHNEAEVHPDKNVVLRAMQKFYPVVPEYHGTRWFVREAHKVSGKVVRHATPIAAVFVVIMTTDLVFALDSIPAIFAVTTDAFIVTAANVFSLMGMLALYFVLEGMMDKFRFLQEGLAVVLGIIGVKMLIADVWHMPVEYSLIAIVVVLTAAVALSLRYPEVPEQFREALDQSGAGLEQFDAETQTETGSDYHNKR